MYGVVEYNGPSESKDSEGGLVDLQNSDTASLILQD